MKQLDEKQLLIRVNLQISLDQLAGQIVKEFNLGELMKFVPLPVGYEELNCLLGTSRGKYIVKIFSKDKTLPIINSNVTALIEYSRGGVPVPKLYQDKADNFLYQIKNNPKAYLVVMDYFAGKKFTEVEPTTLDLINVTKILAAIHKLSFKTSANYDIWLTIHLDKEFAKKYQYLSLENLQLIKPVIKQFQTIDYNRLTKSVVHYDLHRENAMKGNQGKYCILDLASTDYSYKVFDLATFMALFCLDYKKPYAENQKIYQLVLKTYLEAGKLNDYEKNILPLLIKASYASNLLIPEYLQKTGQDENQQQTNYYKSMGRGGLKLWQSIKITDL